MLIHPEIFLQNDMHILKSNTLNYVDYAKIIELYSSDKQKYNDYFFSFKDLITKPEIKEYVTLTDKIENIGGAYEEKYKKTPFSIRHQSELVGEPDEVLRFQKVNRGGQGTTTDEFIYVLADVKFFKSVRFAIKGETTKSMDEIWAKIKGLMNAMNSQTQKAKENTGAAPPNSPNSPAKRNKNPNKQILLLSAENENEEGTTTGQEQTPAEEVDEFEEWISATDREFDYLYNADFELLDMIVTVYECCIENTELAKSLTNSILASAMEGHMHEKAYHDSTIAGFGYSLYNEHFGINLATVNEKKVIDLAIDISDINYYNHLLVYMFDNFENYEDFELTGKVIKRNNFPRK